MTDELTGANNQLALFGKTFGQIKADWKRGYGLKSLSNVISADDMQQLKNYSKWLMNGTKSTEDFKDAMSYCSTATQKLGSEILKLKVKVDKGEMSTEEATTEMNRMIVAEETATGTTNALRSAFGKLALNLAISFAISALITLFTEMSQAEQKAIDKANELAQAYKTQQDTVSELKKEYIDIVDGSKSETEKTKDLYEWKKKLIKAYGYEKDAIEGVTTARATGLKFFDKEEYQNAKDYIAQNGDKYRDILKAFNNVQISGNGIIPDLDSIFAYNKPVLNNIDNIKKEVNDYLKEYGIVYNGLRAVDEYAYSLSLNYGENIYDAIKNINSVLSDIDTKELNNVPLTSFEKTLRGYLKSVLESLKKQVDDSKDVLSETGQAYFTKYFHEFLNIDANKLDNVTIDNFDEWKSRFNKYLEDHAKELLNDTNFNEIKDEYFSNLKLELFPNEVISQTNQYGYSLSTLSEKFAELKDVIDDTSKKQTAIQSALEKIRQGTSLTTDEMNKVAEAYPDLLGKFKQTVDGWTIGADELVDANEKVAQSIKDSVDSQKESLTETIEKIKIQLSETPVINSQDDYLAWQKKQEQLNKDLDDAQNQIKGLDNLVKSFGNDLSGLTEKLKEYNDSLKYCETLNKRLVNLNQGKSLLTSWADTTDWKSDFSSIVDAIIEAFPQNAKIKEAANRWFVEQTKEAARGLVDEYETAYTEDLNNFNTYLTAKFNYADKYSEDGTSWKSFLSANTEFVNEFKSAYDIDLTNYKNWIDARADLQKKLLELDDELFDPLTQSAERERLWKEFTDGVEARFNAYLGGINNPKYNPYPDAGGKSGSSSDSTKDAYTEEQKELKHLLEMEKITQKQYYEMLFGSDEYKALLANRTKYRDELNSIDEEYYKYQQNLYKENADKQFDDLEDQRKRGIITAEQYAQGLHDLRQELYGKDSIYGGTEFAIKALEELDKKVKETSEDIYDEFKEGLSADGDRLLNDVLADADKLSEKNIKLFFDDPKTFKKNAEDIFKTVSKSAKDALDKMLITPDEYLQIIDKWGDKLNIAKGLLEEAKELSESDYLDAWDLENGFDSKKSADNFGLRAERIKYIFELAEQLYGKEGQDNVKAYNELIKQGLEDEQSLVEDYYDKEIEKLEKINDEEEKRQKAIELQMNLIKARQKLEDAKKQKNQLVFYNGTFEYMEDQEAVKSAREDVLEAEKAILEQQVEDQKEALEKRKKVASEFFNKVEGDVSGALERIEKFISGDTSVYEKPVDKVNSISNESDNKINTIGNLGTKGLFEKLIILFGGIPANNSMRDFMESFASTLIGKQIIPTTIRDAITNNSSTTNNTAKTEIHIDKIFENLNMPQGTTKEQVEEFFKHLNQAILQRIPQVILDVKK